MNQSNMLNYKSIIQTLNQSTAQPIIDDVLTSVTLLANSVFGLFINSKPQSLIRKIIRVETKSDSNKRKVIYYAKDLDCSRMLDLISSLNIQEIKNIGADFFYITSKRFAKSQSIENYTRFCWYMYSAFGFDSQFIKSFFTIIRDIDDICAFLNYIINWQIDGRVEMIERSIYCCLDKLSYSGQCEELFKVLRQFNPHVINSISYQNHMQKFLLSSVYNVINRGSARENLEELLEGFNSMGYVYTQFVCNKLMDIMNKNMKNNGFTDIVLHFMEKHHLEANIITYNTIMDFYCITGRFGKAYELYKSLNEKKIPADSFTYSILIKGVKSMDIPDVDAACELFEEYKQNTPNKDIIIYNNIVDVLVSTNQLDKAELIVKEIESLENLKADAITYNILIKGCCRNKDFDNCFKYFNNMRQAGFKPNRIAYNNIMDLAVKVEQMEKALQVLEYMQQDEISADGFTYSIILNGLKINDSKIQLIEKTLNKIKNVIEDNSFKLDEVFFNSIFDLCVKYDLFTFLQHFYKVMKAKNVQESGVTYGILLKSYCKASDYNKAIEVLKQMMSSGIAISEVTYGSVLDSCTKSGNMDLSMKLYNVLKETQSNLSSIVFTTLLSGFIKAEKYKEGIEFFNSVKYQTHLSGMLITFNCALDVMVRMNDMDNAYKLFEEIETNFKADIISYSTIIKGLCQFERKKEALECMKGMINNLVDVDISVVNLLLDSCATIIDYKIAIQGYQFAMMKNLTPNEVTFGIMVKVYGFSRELQKAFDLLDLMAVYEIQPSIIVYTNLVHISFYNRNPKKAEVAFTLFKRLGLKGDRLLYSKLISGLCKFKESGRVCKYIDYAISDNVGLKPDCIELLYDIFEGDYEMIEKMELIQEVGRKEKRVQHSESNTDRFKNKKNVKPATTRPPIVHEKPYKNTTEPVHEDNKRSLRKFDNTKPYNTQAKPGKEIVFSNNNNDESKKPLGLFNFRQKKTN